MSGQQWRGAVVRSGGSAAAAVTAARGQISLFSPAFLLFSSSPA
jgi:hypothetical protein